MVTQTIQITVHASQLKLALRCALAVLAVFVAFPCKLSAEQSIAWTEDYESAVQRAAATNSVLLLHFYGDYCPPCKLLDKKTFRDPTLVSLINESVIPVKINADKRRDLAKEYNVTRWPTDVYVGQGGDELYRGISDQDPTVYGTKIKRIMLVHRDRTLERQSIAQQTQRRQDQQLAASSPQIQGEKPVYAGTAGHATKTQSSQWSSQPTNLSSPVPSGPTPVFVATKPARVIDNPYLQQQPIQVPAAEQVPPPIANTPSMTPPQARTTQEVLNPNSVERYTSAQAELSRPAAQLVSSQSDRTNEPSKPNEPAKANVPSVTTIVPTTIGLEGYCPVALIDSLNKSDIPAWVIGSPVFAAKHRGRIYHCSSEAARQLLLSNPDLYTPSLSCCDLVHFFRTRELVDGKCQYGCIQPKTNRVFLFANQDNFREFEARIEQYSQLLDQATQERVASLPDDNRIR